MATTTWQRNQASAGIETLVSSYIEPTFSSEQEQFSDTGNGQRLAENHKQHVRYVPEWGWLHFEQGVWRRDGDRVIVNEAAKQTLRRMADTHLNANDVSKVGLAQHGDWLRHTKYSFNHIEQMVRSARSVDGIRASISQFDNNRMLLNCTNGVVDLHDGRLLRHAEASDMFTKQASVAYDPRADAPLWRQFLNGVFQSDQELIRWVQKALGYSLTGDTREQVFFICYGGGRNGKSTLREVVSAIQGDYARPLKADALMDNPFRNGSGADPELAGLVGARFVTAAEPRERGRDKAPILDTGRVKELTGGDTLQVRELHKMPFDFHPAFKLWLSVNNRPEIPESTVGMWRRIRLIPFNAHFEGDRENKNIKQELIEQEAAGILNWLVEGCLLWQVEGLGEPPAAIRDATSDYHEHEDEYQPFFEKVLVRGESPDTAVLLQDAWKAFMEWRGKAGAPRLADDRAFARVAEAHTLVKKRLTAGPNKGKYALFGCRVTTPQEREASEGGEVTGDTSEGSEDTTRFCTNTPIEHSIEHFVQNTPSSSPSSPPIVTVALNPPGEVIDDQAARLVPVLTPPSHAAKVALAALRADREAWLALGDTDELRQWVAQAGDATTWRGAYHLLPPCPNRNHRHGGAAPACAQGKLPLARTLKLPETPVVLAYGDDGTSVTSYEHPGIDQLSYPYLDEAVAAMCEREGIPVSSRLSDKLEGLRQRYAHEMAKLTCDHGDWQHPTRGAVTRTLCGRCGADLTTGKVV